MSAFVRYELLNFIRSLKFIPPVVIYLAWIFILYAYKNVPILSSYGVSSIAIYLVMTWLAMAMFSMEEESEKHILFAHLGSKWRYLRGKWHTLFLMMIPLMLFAVFFPIITGSFNDGMTIEYYLLTFFCHTVFAIFGVLVGTLFSATGLAVKRYAWLSAVFVIVCSLASKSLIETAAFLKWVLWIFPPVFNVIEHMGNEFIVNTDFWINIIFVIIYITLTTIIVVLLFLKKER
ncbi:hypothetical protein ACFFHH_17550 [Cytobacillus solani]|uniref:Uncharacterized protein n=1 Tax=Cytobacillus solani TaxID=1637975 RepID=A0A0Q3QLX5_9BACI|nr:hypothetical protein [Cytobacillus solani]KOP81804.1 hypothetical protein AMS60_04485 [Bacillus sp. FJAT-21945]KQL18742.1 hypothetical protein AN957_09255 [Cytobacillus solani]